MESLGRKMVRLKHSGWLTLSLRIDFLTLVQAGFHRRFDCNLLIPLYMRRILS